MDGTLRVRNTTLEGMLTASQSQVDKRFESLSTNGSRCTRPPALVCDSSPAPPDLYALAAAQLVSVNRPVVRLDSKRSLAGQSDLETEASRRTSVDGSEILLPQDGVYLVIVRVTAETGALFDVRLDIEMRNPTGFLSATDYPLLHFYAFMCVVYLGFAVYWSLVSVARWRDLLRIHFWIGVVILLGMIEKAVFYAEHLSVNSTGHSVKYVVLLAVLASCV